MKSILKKLSQGLLLVPALVLGLSFATAPAVSAVECNPDDLNVGSGADCAQGDQTPTSLFGDGSVFQTVTNILLFLIGAISVIMLIIGGIRYVLSSGDQAQVTSAKNTILYAIIGIVVAFLAYAAVAFVSGQFTQS